MESRHSWHTGSREMFTRGISQSLQLEGKSTAKTLRIDVTIGATRDVRCSARSARRCRSRVARLLKTTLQSIVPPTRNARARYRGTESTCEISIVISAIWCNAEADSREPDSSAFHAGVVASGALAAPNPNAVPHDRMDALLACTCTKCYRHANLRRHSYLRFARGLRI
jgi:hypothetical protein